MLLDLSGPWAYAEDQLEGLLAEAHRRTEGLDLEALATKPGRSLDSAPRVEERDGVGIIPIKGLLTRQSGGFLAFLFGGTSYDALARDVTAAVESARVRAILLDVDSPGGDAQGVDELADIIYRARLVKPVKAFIGGWGASAAYWLASAASEITTTPASLSGSIGVRWATVDTSRLDQASGVKRVVICSSQSPYKNTDPSKPADLARVQQRVDDLAGVFVGAVARYRGCSTRTVLEDFGKGDVLVGAKAKAAGLVDRIGSFEDALADISGRVPGTTPTTGARASAAATETTMKIKCSGCGESIDTESDDVYCEGCADDDAKAIATSARAALGFAADAKRDDVVNAVTAIGRFRGDIVALAGKADAAEVLGQIAAWKASHDAAGPLRAELVALKGGARVSEFDALVEKGVKEGKITPAQKSGAWLKGLRDRDDGAAQITSFLAEAAPVVQLDKTHRERDPKDLEQATALSDEELKVCAQMGLSVEQYKKNKLERIKAGRPR